MLITTILVQSPNRLGDLPGPAGAGQTPLCRVSNRRYLEERLQLVHQATSQRSQLFGMAASRSFPDCNHLRHAGANLRKNLKKIMFTPSWVGKKTVTRQKLYSGAFDFCNFLERIGELPSLECIDIVVEGVSQGGLWYDGWHTRLNLWG